MKRRHKNFQKKKKTRPVAAELYHTDGRTDIMELRVKFENLRLPLRHAQKITMIASPKILDA